MGDKPEASKIRPDQLHWNGLKLTTKDFAIKPPKDSHALVATLGLTLARELFGDTSKTGRPREQCASTSAEEGDKSKFTIPKRLEQAFKDLASRDYETHQKAMKDLAAKATLQELVAIRHKVPDLDVDQGLRLNLLIKASVEHTWQKEFSENPRKFAPNISDPQVLRALMTYLPKELEQDCRQVEKESWGFLYEKKVPTAKDYENAALKLERVAALCQWLDKAAKSDGATADLKRLSADFEQHFILNDAMTRLVEVHERLAKADPRLVSDAKDIKKETKQMHAEAARRTYLDLVKTKKFSLNSLDFWSQTLRFLTDKTTDHAVYAETIKALTDNVIKDEFTGYLIDNSRAHLLDLFGRTAKAVPAAKARLLNQPYDRIAADLERHIVKVSDPAKRLEFQTDLIEKYIDTDRFDKAKLLLAKAKETADLLPEDERKRQLKELKRLNDKLEDKDSVEPRR
jgi:hypothetical protein